MKPKTKKILLSFALVIAFFLVCVATGGCLNFGASPEGGSLYTVAGLVNGLIELALIIYVFIKLMNKEIL